MWSGVGVLQSWHMLCGSPELLQQHSGQCAPLPVVEIRADMQPLTSCSVFMFPSGNGAICWVYQEEIGARNGAFSSFWTRLSEYWFSFILASYTEDKISSKHWFQGNLYVPESVVLISQIFLQFLSLWIARQDTSYSFPQGFFFF